MIPQNVNITPPAGVLEELEYMVELHQDYGAESQQYTVDELMVYIIYTVATASRRFNQDDHRLLDILGLMPRGDVLEYRTTFGRP